MPERERPDPEELLRRVQQDETRAKRGQLKIFLGFAAGVGKTVAMLEEGYRRRERGEDVVVGFFESHGRKETIERLRDLEVVPRRRLLYRDREFEEMDTEAILKRHPAVCMVDELAHTNVPGSEREKRWEDVGVILDAGINVLGTVNIQHLESLNDKIAQITGVRVQETIPDRILDEADELVVVDITPTALRHRLERGSIYPAERVPVALENFFRETNLAALRELALRQTADEVEDDLTEFRRRDQITQVWGAQERILACISPHPAMGAVIRRGKRLADRVHGEFFVLYVAPMGGLEELDPQERQVVEDKLELARRLDAQVFVIRARDVAAEVVRFAREHQVTQICLGRSLRTRWQQLLRSSIINQIVMLADGIDVHIVADR
jgi:two-component system sensor histidine kinase KdpD